MLGLSAFLDSSAFALSDSMSCVVDPIPGITSGILGTTNTQPATTISIAIMVAATGAATFLNRLSGSFMVLESLYIKI